MVPENLVLDHVQAAAEATRAADRGRQYRANLYRPAQIKDDNCFFSFVTFMLLKFFFLLWTDFYKLFELKNK